MIKKLILAALSLSLSLSLGQAQTAAITVDRTDGSIAGPAEIDWSATAGLTVTWPTFDSTDLDLADDYTWTGAHDFTGGTITVTDADLPSTLTRDAEAAAAYEPLGVAAADLTDATADGIALITTLDGNSFTDADESKLDALDDDLQTLSLPASTTISTYGATLADDADAATARTTLGLGNVDNTADADKPVSTATQTELDAALARDNKRAFAGGVRFDGGSILCSPLLGTDTLTNRPIAIGGWIKVSESGLSANRVYFGTSSVSTSTAGASLRIQTPASNALIFNFNSVPTAAVEISNFVVDYAGQWVHVLGVADSTGGYLYINGELAASDLDTAGDWASTNYSLDYIVFGIGDSSGEKFDDNEQLREFLWGNTALTATEAAEISSTGLEAFIAAHPEYQWADATEGATYTADWSAGVDSWANLGSGSFSGNNDSIGPSGDLRDDCFTYVSGNSGRAGFQSPGVMEVGKRYRVNFDYFTPTGSDFVGLKWMCGPAFSSGDSIILGANQVVAENVWTSIEFEVSHDDARLQLKLVSSGTLGADMNGFGSDDDMSVRNLRVTQVGIGAALPLDEGIGYQHRDLSSNHNDALASATGVYHLKTKREGSLRAFGIDAYNGGSGDVELVSSSRDVLPANAIIKESFVRNNGAGSIASGALDVKRSNRTTRNIIGDNGGLLDGGLVENITITAQQTPTYNNVALDSADADATDIDIRIDYELID